jgi:hypothetical protein
MAEKISKKKFLSVYNSNEPNFWVKFIFKYFSKETSKDKLIPKKVIVVMLSLFFFLGFFGTAFNAKYELIKIVTIAYAILLSVFGLSIVSAVIMNNFRIRKIAKELNITLEKYEELLKIYF